MYDQACVNWKEMLQTVLRGSGRRMPRTPEPALRYDSDVTETLDTASLPTISAPIWRRRYRPVRELGEGGMGRVLLAERLPDSFLVCLKFLNPDTDPRTAEQECRALMRLRHPSIVSLLDFSIEDKPLWLATEYVEGSTLHEYLKKHRPLADELVLEIVKLLLAALEYAHGEKVIHRDLKPSNLMINMEGGVQMRILDFGIAIIDEFDHTGRLTASGADPLGTLLYMAPEQLQGQQLTSACDLYAVGLIAWEMLMGRGVFEGKTRAQMMHEKVTRGLGFGLSEARSASVPAALGSFVEACTHPQPGARPTASEGLAVLRSL